MASTALIDTEALLAPISEDAPAGNDCRLDPSLTSYYQQIKAARNSARAEERNNVLSGGGQEADEHWRKVVELAPKILTEQCKDLEVTSWYIEALVRRYSFHGLRDGFQLLAGLIERYWDNLYPMPDEEGIETRVASLAGLNGEGSEGVLIAPLRNLIITQGSSSGPFTYWQYQQALEAQRNPDNTIRENKIKALGFDVDVIEKAVSESSSDFMTDLRDDIQESIALFKGVSQRLNELCGTYDAPPSSNIINILDDCLSSVVHLGKDKFPVAAIEEAEATMEMGDDGQPQAVRPAAGGPIASREQAFKQLNEISEFFLRTEPHSPVSYILQKAVKWGNMPLFELMQELIPEANALAHYSMLTGVKTED